MVNQTILETRVSAPKGTEALVTKILERTQDYIKAKEILIKQYNIAISLVVMEIKEN